MGWNGSGGASTPVKPKVTAKKPSPIRGIIAGLVIVLAAVAYFVFFSGSEKPQKVEVQKKPTAIKEVKPVPKAQPQVAEKEEAPKKKVEEDTWLGVKVDHRRATTNGTMIIETIYTVDGKSHKYYHDTTPQVFDNASDQILALATADAPGGNAPPLPGLGPNFENEFADSLKKEIVINDDDSPAVKEVKERVKQARQDMLDAMGAGMSAQDVLLEHRKMQENNAALRMEAVNGLKEYLEKGDTEGAQEYVEKMNQALEQMGIMKIELPRSKEEIRAERLERSAARRAKKEEKK